MLLFQAIFVQQNAQEKKNQIWVVILNMRPRPDLRRSFYDFPGSHWSAPFLHWQYIKDLQQKYLSFPWSSSSWLYYSLNMGNSTTEIIRHFHKWGIRDEKVERQGKIPKISALNPLNHP